MAEVKNSIKFSTGGGSEITVVANYSALPDPTTVSGEFYWCSSSQGTSWLPGSLGGTFYNSGLYYSNGTTWEFLNVPFNATQAEVNTGTNNDKFVTPKTFTDADKWSTKQDNLTFDSTPTNSSTNPVTSGGVFDALPKTLVLGSDITTTSTSAVNTNLSHPIAANEVLKFTVDISATTSAGGIKLQVTTPAGAVVKGGLFAVGSTSTTIRILGLAANTLTSASMQTNAVTSPIQMTFTVENGATAGDVILSFASGTGGSTTIDKCSAMQIFKPEIV